MVSYIGGKSRISKMIIPHIPQDMETFVEVFGGMFWLFFKTDLSQYKNLKRVVYNDKNPHNVNLIRCVNNVDEFLDVIKGITYVEEDKDTFNHYKEELFSKPFKIGDEPDYDRGFMYAYILTTCFSGSNPEKANCVKNGGHTKVNGEYVSKFQTFLNKLTNPKWVDKFKSIDFIHNLDFKDVIEKYDSPTTFLYLDPPYFTFEDYYAKHDFGYDDHKRLADTIKECESKWILSYYEFDLLNEWFPKDEYRRIEKEYVKASGARKGKKQNKSVELLIINF
jgi:DNA adenine methylase